MESSIPNAFNFDTSFAGHTKSKSIAQGWTLGVKGLIVAFEAF